MRFLVTGAAGFIGSAVVRRLNQGGNEVAELPRRQLDLLHASAAELRRAVRDSRATHCIHTAWYTNHKDYLVHEVNAEWAAATLRLADAFEAAGGKRFLGLGTCLEYDVSAAVDPLSETSKLSPHTLYAKCKLKAQEALADRQLDTVWARIFFVYGPGDRAGRLIPQMLASFRERQPSGPNCGALRRDYIHVDDLAGQLVSIAMSGVQGPINTGSGQAPTLSEIYHAGADAFGRPDLARPNDEDCGQPPLIQADMRRFQETVGELHARSISQGLRDLTG